MSSLLKRKLSKAMLVATRTKGRGKRQVPKSYLNLIVELPLASIKTQQQFDVAQAMMDRLNEAYRLIGAARELPQTADTISWVIDELNAEQTDKFENYAYNLSMLLVDADPALLLPRESDILDTRHFLGELRAPLTDRLQMLSWEEATCWH